MNGVLRKPDTLELALLDKENIDFAAHEFSAPCTKSKQQSNKDVKKQYTWR
jgi:hypothetical protein